MISHSMKSSSAFDASSPICSSTESRFTICRFQLKFHPDDGAPDVAARLPRQARAPAGRPASAQPLAADGLLREPGKRGHHKVRLLVLKLFPPKLYLVATYFVKLPILDEVVNFRN